MTDFTTETRKVCSQNVRFHTKVPASKGGGEYHVSFGVENPGEYQSNWHCTCPGFQYRRDCKHVEQAKARKCDAGWDAYAGGPGIEGDKCPKCGSPVEIIKIAV
jgi:hypothetical protein